MLFNHLFVDKHPIFYGFNIFGVAPSQTFNRSFDIVWLTLGGCYLSIPIKIGIKGVVNLEWGQKLEETSRTHRCHILNGKFLVDSKYSYKEQ